MKGIFCDNTKELAKRVYELMKTKHKKYTLRPYNRYQNLNSTWWIIPLTDFPAYRYGKYIIWENEGEISFSLGLHIEKGVKNPVESDKKLLINDTWIWNEFINDLSDGEIEDILLSINKIQDSSIKTELLIDI